MLVGLASLHRLTAKLRQSAPYRAAVATHQTYHHKCAIVHTYFFLSDKLVYFVIHIACSFSTTLRVFAVL